jgi:NCS2 family nucleobase:cation symporter-2
VFGLIIAKPFAMMIRFFPPLVAGTVICVIGLSLIGADVSLIAGNNPAAASYGQMSHIALAGLVILLIVVITRVFRGFISQIAVLLVCNHWTWRRPQSDDAIDEAPRYGAVSDGQQAG